MNHDVTIYENIVFNTSTPKSGYEVSISENIEFNNTFKASNNTSVTVVNNIEYNNEVVAGKLISVVIEDNFNYSNSVKTNAEYLATIVNKVEVNSFVNSFKEENGEIVLDDNLDCWVVNYENNAFSRYSNFDFNSFAELNGNYYGVNQLGLFKLDGKTDGDREIPAKIKTGMLDVSGRGSLSYVRDLIIYHKSDGTLRLNVKGNDGRTECYRLMNPSDNLVTSRVKDFSIGRKMIYWQFELTNDEQTDFEIGEVKIYRVITGRVT